MIHVPVEKRWPPVGGEGGGGSSFALLNPPRARLGNKAFKEEKLTFPSEKCVRRDIKFVPSEQYSPAFLSMRSQSSARGFNISRRSLRAVVTAERQHRAPTFFHCFLFKPDASAVEIYIVNV